MHPHAVRVGSTLQSLAIAVSRWRWGPFGYLHMWMVHRYESRPVTERLKSKLAYKVEPLNHDYGKVFSK